MAKSKRDLIGAEARKVILIILFVPSADREGEPLPDGEQEKWVHNSLTTFGTHFGGATAMPPAKGVWRDGDEGANLVYEDPVLVHCYASVSDVNSRPKMLALGRYCRELLKGTKQGEVGLIVDNVYHAIRS